MEYRSAKGFTGWAQLGILFGFVGAGLILAGVTQLFIAKSLIDPNTPLQQMGDAMMKALFKPENVMYLQLSQVAGTLFLMFLPTVAYSLICNGKNVLWIGFSKHLNPLQVVLGFLIIYCANVVANPAADFSRQIVSHFAGINRMAQNLENNYNDQIVAMSNLRSGGQLITALLIMAFLPAMFEEMFFRGTVQNLFIRWWKRPWWAIVVTALLFSLIHGSIYLFLSRAILGFALGMMYYQSKNLWVNIIAHFLNNAVAVVQLFLITRHGEKPGLSNMDGRFPLWVELLSFAVFYLLFVLFKKISANNRTKIEIDVQQMRIHSDPYRIQQTEQS